MKDEIKEIDRIIINVKRKLQFSPERRFVELFNKDEINKLLDYITNLQEELETYKDTETYSKSFLYKENKERLKANQRLQEENEKLKEKIGRLEDRLINRRTRIDKASGMIEFIAFNSERPLTMIELNKVYNILQGSDKDE